MPPLIPEFRHDLLIGIDDTDNAESIGTGKLCRMLADELRSGGFTVRGVTRHQHLVHPDIPYTSNNSSCALGLDGDALDLDRIERFCADFLARHEHPGADPGLCVVAVADLNRHSDLAAPFGRSTQEVVLSKEDARAVASKLSARLSEHGGTGLGIIGALGAACLRAGGNDGRLLDMGRLPELTGLLTVAHLESTLPIAGIFAPDGVRLPSDACIDTADWVRPDLHDFRPVLNVFPVADNLWTTRVKAHVEH